jgi:hypothetical protein
LIRGRATIRGAQLRPAVEEAEVDRQLGRRRLALELLVEVAPGTRRAAEQARARSPAAGSREDDRMLTSAAAGSAMMVSGSSPGETSVRMFWQQRSAGPLSAAVTALLMREPGASPEDMSALRMIEERGHYAGRSVTYFRVFNPATALSAGVVVRRFRDLEGLTDLRTGHTERDGAVVLNGT